MQRIESVLFTEFMSGNDDSFSKLYKICFPQLYAYGISLKANQEIVKDAIQDVFLKIYSKRVVLDQPGSLKPFLFRSIKNYYINYLKKSNKNIHITNESIEFVFSYSIEDKIIIDDNNRMLQNRIRNILRNLTWRQAEIIYLRYMYEMDFEEISMVLEMSVQATRNLLSRALKRMREEDIYLHQLQIIRNNS